MHLVLANLLHNRKDVVTLVERAQAQGGKAQGGSAAEEDGGDDDELAQGESSGLQAPLAVGAVDLSAVRVERPADEPDIERLLVHEVVQRHTAHQRGSGQGSGNWLG